MYNRALFLFCLLMIFGVTPAWPASKFAPKSAMLTPAQVSNPKPAAGDVLLPMPEGLQMAFRVVCIPSRGYLDAVEESHGMAEGGNASRNFLGGYVTQQHTVSLSAPYTLKDLPQAWGKDVLSEIAADPACAASASSGLRTHVYLIGKYEVSRAQWRAVMAQDTSPFALQTDDYLPQGGISWVDAVNFTHRYTEWLMANKPEYLPFFSQEKRSAFIRLPSEQEWEFAARGGHKVSPAERGTTNLFPMPSGGDPKEYISAQVYVPTLSGATPIGLRKPNPLGLHDMLGNVDEMVSSPFQLVSGGRLIGGHGGFIIKGGSWRSGTVESLHPGRRLEAAYYINGKALVRDDMGIRVSLGSILTPRERREALQQEWAAMSAPVAAKATPVDDVRVVIREVVREVESPALRKKLAQAENIASLYHQKVNESEERMIRETLLGALFSLETIANYGVRGYQVAVMKETHALASGGAKTADGKEVAVIEKEIRGFTEGIQSALFYYQGMLRESSRFDKERIKPQLEKITLQFVHDNGFSRSMRRRISVLDKHLKQKNSASLPAEKLLADILPDWLRVKLKPYW